MSVFINRTSVFLPNEPVSNDEMETYLGQINGQKSKSKSIVLRNNGIGERYYALKKGDKLLLAVPESSRFSYAFGLLTVC